MKSALRWIAGLMSIVFVAETLALSFLPACHAPGSEPGRASNRSTIVHAHTQVNEGVESGHGAPRVHHTAAAPVDADAVHALNIGGDDRDHDGATPVDRFACCHLLALSAGLAVRVLPRPSQEVMLPASAPHPSDRIERIERPPRA